jgi:type IV pilus assembly protein PilQ
MTLTRGFALIFTVLAAGVLLHADVPAGDNAVPSSVRLKAISARVHSQGTSLVIEASEPAAYVATRPDPLTVLLEFRNTSASGVAKAVAPGGKSAIASVNVEAAGTAEQPGSRVRITLSQPVAHRVRSDRNTVVVDFDKVTARTVPYVMPPAPAVDPIAALGLDQKGAAVLAQSSARNQAAAPSQTPAPQAQPPQAQTPPAPAQPEQPRPTDQVTAPGQKKYSGHPISMDFQGADLRAVLRVFAEDSGLNIVLDPTVQGTVDVALRDVPWDQALDMILRANKLGYLVDGTIVRIAPLTVLADEEAQRRKLSEEQALAGQLQVLTKTLSYAKGEELQALLTKSTLSQRGTVQVDPRTNTLIITDLPERLQTAQDLITTLDRPQPQVEIEARIVQTNKNYARALGVQWGFNGIVSPQLGNTTNLAFPNNGSLGGRTGGTQGPAGGTASSTAVNLGVPAATSAVGLALGAVNGAFNLDVALSALESSGNGRVLSTPKVSTLNNVAAEMTQGVQIPIQTVANNTVTVNFKDAALTLKVTPQITSANTVIMQISVENASPDFSRAVNNIPPINTQRANTTVLVNDGNTTVIGGIYVSQEQTANDRTPGVSRLPLFGWLFKRDSLNDQSTELLIFITPRIIRG